MLLRFVWTLTLVPPKYLADDGRLVTVFTHQDQITPLLAGAEIVRRAMWGILRCEYEFLSQHEEPGEGALEEEGGGGGFGMEVEMEKMRVGDGQGWLGGEAVERLGVPKLKDMSEAAVLLELGLMAAGFMVCSIIGAFR